MKPAKLFMLATLKKSKRHISFSLSIHFSIHFSVHTSVSPSICPSTPLHPLAYLRHRLKSRWAVVICLKAHQMMSGSQSYAPCLKLVVEKSTILNLWTVKYLVRGTVFHKHCFHTLYLLNCTSGLTYLIVKWLLSYKVIGACGLNWSNTVYGWIKKAFVIPYHLNAIIIWFLVFCCQVSFTFMVNIQ